MEQGRGGIPGDKTLTAVKMKDTVTGDLSTLEVAGAFEAIGHKPNTAFS